MAHRGRDTLRFGPMKPVGLVDPRTGRAPYAVVQLRQDNLAGDHFSLVGFQTQIKWGEQARVLRMIPGLEQAEFVRFGMVHRNTYINGPTVLRETWQTRRAADLFFAGQMSGVEGYVESAASGLLAGRNAAALVRGEAPRAPPRTTAIGALAYYVSHADPRALPADQHHVRHHGAAAECRRATRWRRRWRSPSARCATSRPGAPARGFRLQACERISVGRVRVQLQKAEVKPGRASRNTDDATGKRDRKRTLGSSRKRDRTKSNNRAGAPPSVSPRLTSTPE